MQRFRSPVPMFGWIAACSALQTEKCDQKGCLEGEEGSSASVSTLLAQFKGKCQALEPPHLSQNSTSVIARAGSLDPSRL
jgi:hypothetical protein